MKSPSSVKILAKNKKAYFDYEVMEKYEAGIVLTGAEVKSIKEGRVQLKGSFAAVARGPNGKLRVIAENMHISAYRYSSTPGHDPLRPKELLLHRKEIDFLAGESTQKGFTLIPLEIFLKNNMIKVLLGVCRGKKAHDKRNVLKKRAMAKEVMQGLKKFTR